MSTKIFNKLSQDNQSKVKTWINRIDIKNATTSDLSWILSDHKKIADYIEKKYPKLNTKKTHYIALSNALKILGNKEKAEKYSDIATEYNEDYVEKTKEQKIKPSREKHYVTWKELMNKRKELKSEVKKYPDYYKINLQYLIVSLFTYQPPLRQ